MSDLSLAVARLIEPELPPIAEWGDPSPKGAWRPGYRTPNEWVPRPFASDRNLLPIILKAVEERELEDRYVTALHEVLRQEFGMICDWHWLSLGASMEQHCAAFLAAVGEPK